MLTAVLPAPRPSSGRAGGTLSGATRTKPCNGEPGQHHGQAAAATPRPPRLRTGSVFPKPSWSEPAPMARRTATSALAGSALTALGSPRWRRQTGARRSLIRAAPTGARSRNAGSPHGWVGSRGRCCSMDARAQVRRAAEALGQSRGQAPKLVGEARLGGTRRQVRHQRVAEAPARRPSSLHPRHPEQLPDRWGTRSRGP